MSIHCLIPSRLRRWGPSLQFAAHLVDRVLPEVPYRQWVLPWADLLKRVFGDDLLRCPCGGRRRVVAFIPEPKKAQAILAALKIEAPLRIAKARPPPHQECFALPRVNGGVDPVYPD
jgi:hypothetical protein